jgi:hypothetical protein
MAGRSDIRDLILAAAEGAAGGLTALRSTDAAVRLEDFEVELGLAEEGGAGMPGGLSAAVRFTLVALNRGE